MCPEASTAHAAPARHDSLPRVCLVFSPSFSFLSAGWTGLTQFTHTAFSNLSHVIEPSDFPPYEVRLFTSPLSAMEATPCGASLPVPPIPWLIAWSVAAYRDSELVKTLYSALHHAHFPARLFPVILWQGDLRAPCCICRRDKETSASLEVASQGHLGTRDSSPAASSSNRTQPSESTITENSNILPDNSSGTRAKLQRASSSTHGSPKRRNHAEQVGAEEGGYRCPPVRRLAHPEHNRYLTLERHDDETPKTDERRRRCPTQVEEIEGGWSPPSTDEAKEIIRETSSSAVDGGRLTDEDGSVPVRTSAGPFSPSVTPPKCGSDFPEVNEKETKRRRHETSGSGKQEIHREESVCLCPCWCHDTPPVRWRRELNSSVLRNEEDSRLAGDISRKGHEVTRPFLSSRVGATPFRQEPSGPLRDGEWPRVLKGQEIHAESPGRQEMCTGGKKIPDEKILENGGGEGGKKSTRLTQGGCCDDEHTQTRHSEDIPSSTGWGVHTPDSWCSGGPGGVREAERTLGSKKTVNEEAFSLWEVREFFLRNALSQGRQRTPPTHLPQRLASTASSSPRCSSPSKSSSSSSNMPANSSSFPSSSSSGVLPTLERTSLKELLPRLPRWVRDQLHPPCPRLLDYRRGETEASSVSGTSPSPLVSACYLLSLPRPSVPPPSPPRPSYGPTIDTSSCSSPVGTNTPRDMSINPSAPPSSKRLLPSLQHHPSPPPSVSQAISDSLKSRLSRGDGSDHLQNEKDILHSSPFSTPPGKMPCLPSAIASSSCSSSSPLLESACAGRPGSSFSPSSSLFSSSKMEEERSAEETPQLKKVFFETSSPDSSAFSLSCAASSTCVASPPDSTGVCKEESLDPRSPENLLLLLQIPVLDICCPVYPRWTPRRKETASVRYGATCESGGRERAHSPVRGRSNDTQRHRASLKCSGESEEKKDRSSASFVQHTQDNDGEEFWGAKKREGGDEEKEEREGEASGALPSSSHEGAVVTIRIAFLDFRESRGPCFARYICELLFPFSRLFSFSLRPSSRRPPLFAGERGGVLGKEEGEEERRKEEGEEEEDHLPVGLVLQTDSHMRFARHFDCFLVQQLFLSSLLDNSGHDSSLHRSSSVRQNNAKYSEEESLHPPALLPPSFSSSPSPPCSPSSSCSSSLASPQRSEVPSFRRVREKLRQSKVLLTGYPPGYDERAAPFYAYPQSIAYKGKPSETTLSLSSPSVFASSDSLSVTSRGDGRGKERERREEEEEGGRGRSGYPGHVLLPPVLLCADRFDEKNLLRTKGRVLREVHRAHFRKRLEKGRSEGGELLTGSAASEEEDDRRGSSTTRILPGANASSSLEKTRRDGQRTTRDKAERISSEDCAVALEERRRSKDKQEEERKTKRKEIDETERRGRKEEEEEKKGEREILSSSFFEPLFCLCPCQSCSSSRPISEEEKEEPDKLYANSKHRNASASSLSPSSSSSSSSSVRLPPTSPISISSSVSDSLSSAPSSSFFVCPLRTAFWAAGFSFGPRRLVEEVPYDDRLDFVFFGEEQTMALRLFTHGWRFYTPGASVVFHLWSRDHRPFFKDDLKKEVFLLRTKTSTTAHPSFCTYTSLLSSSASSLSWLRGERRVFETLALTRAENTAKREESTKRRRRRRMTDGGGQGDKRLERMTTRIAFIGRGSGDLHEETHEIRQSFAEPACCDEEERKERERLDSLGLGHVYPSEAFWKEIDVDPISRRIPPQAKCGGYKYSENLFMRSTEREEEALQLILQHLPHTLN